MRLIKRITRVELDNDRLKAENAELHTAFNETLIRLSAANEAAGGGFMDARYCEMLHEMGIEVG